MDLSGYLFEALRKDEEFLLYRGQSKDIASQAAFASYGAPLILGEANVSQEPRRSVSRSRVLVLSSGQCCLTGFSIASRLRRGRNNRQSAHFSKAMNPLEQYDYKQIPPSLAYYHDSTDAGVSRRSCAGK
jgi:hypothetical protein